MTTNFSSIVLLATSDKNRPMTIASGFIVLFILLGTVYTLATQFSAPLLQPVYQLQQLQSGAFLGIVAIGMMMVILLGHIDLSIPWTMTASAIVASSVGGIWAIPAGIATGALVGLLNGLGVAYLRVPSMIFTLGMNAVMRGVVVLITCGFAPQTNST